MLMIKQTKAMYIILYITKELGRIPVRTAFTLFETLVKPITEYGLEVWGLYCSNHALEKFQLRFLKIILEVRSNSSNLMTYGDTGRLPLKLSFACEKDQIH